MTNTVTQLDVFANLKSCDLWARHVGPEEELTLGCITGFFHQRIIAGRQVTKSKHILLSREYHQRQKQTPAGKKESLAHSPSHVSPQRCWQFEAVSIMIAQTDDNVLQNCPCNRVVSCFIKYPMKKRKVITTGKNVTECCPAELLFPDLHIPQISFQSFCALIFKEPTTNNKIIISDTRVYSHQH